MESIALLEESIGWRQEEVRPAATLGRHPSLEAMIRGAAEPDPIRHTASAEHTEAPAGASEVVGEQGAGPRDRNRLPRRSGAATHGGLRWHILSCY
jgi:hypothetical protein